MKTVAISIDEPTLRAVDRIARDEKSASRSRVVRQALGEFIERKEKQAREEQERRVLARHRARLAKDAAALVAEQEDA